MPTEIIVSILTGLITLAGVLISNSKSQAVTETRLEELTREVWEHNNFARCDRLYSNKRGATAPLYLTFQNICFVRILFMKVSLCGIKHFDRNYFWMIPTI